jgi:hypothetical protein
MPNSYHSRPKTKPGPTRAPATGSVWPAACASMTVSFWQKRNLERSSASNCPPAYCKRAANSPNSPMVQKADFTCSGVSCP